MEVSLEKIMLVLVGLCFASLVCVPLIEGGAKQARDQFANSQFESFVSSIDSGIAMVLNSSGQKAFQEDALVPSTVTVNSSMNRVTYYFSSDSVTNCINKDYPINVNSSFNSPSGWYRIRIWLASPTLIAVNFTHIEDL